MHRLQRRSEFASTRSSQNAGPVLTETASKPLGRIGVATEVSEQVFFEIENGPTYAAYGGSSRRRLGLRIGHTPEQRPPCQRGVDLGELPGRRGSAQRRCLQDLEQKPFSVSWLRIDSQTLAHPSAYPKSSGIRNDGWAPD